MRKGSWEPVTEKVPSHLGRIHNGDEVYGDGHDGHVHWVCKLDEIGHQKTILAYDLGLETFSKISLLVDKNDNLYRSYVLGILGGKLCVMFDVTNGDFEVWVLDKYGVAEEVYRSGLVYCSGGLSGKYNVLAVCQIVHCASGLSFLTVICLIRQRTFSDGNISKTLAEGNEGALHLGPERARVYSDLSPEDKDRYNTDIRATNILLQGLPKEIYSLINHYIDAMDIWDNVKMILEGSELTKEDRES
ncbi:integrase, catalytic region, zinc finger, CCHC-type containing protein [Tanacetum coccineum]|uniref:Integrase, catalytic region, zinc finger, CCHC-type containing protein n=1 Tax=Tanacetum coccineum TaxID=301880 RepID=A0ABQ4X9R0_9ASTR